MAERAQQIGGVLPVLLAVGAGMLAVIVIGMGINWVFEALGEFAEKNQGLFWIGAFGLPGLIAAVGYVLIGPWALAIALAVFGLAAWVGISST